VAAFADRHLLVVKGVDGPDAGVVTRSGVVALDDAGRVAELSRMLAGHDSGLARGHAEELLESAEQDKATAGP
jgi:DNA repair protein RecN (Recombination protein N)